MPSEVIRCTDCGATFKAVPTWLVGAKVKFSCTNCPKRPSRVARHEPTPVVMAAQDTDIDEDMEGDIPDDSEDDADMDLPSDEMDDKDEKDM